MTSLLFGFLTAVGFGAGDFFGGLASRRLPVLTAALYSQFFAAIFLFLIALLWGGPVGGGDLLWSAAAGIMGGLAIVRYYRGLACGIMGWVAALVGMLSALVPFVVGVGLGERPTLLAAFGVFTVVGSLIFVTRKRGQKLRSMPVKGLADSLFAGVCFGFSFIFLGQSEAENPLWPVSVLLAASILPVLFSQLRSRLFPRLCISSLAPLFAAGLGQGFGFLAFALAVRDGLVSVVSVAGALSPLLTALLARCFLSEILSRRQTIGLVVAMAGIVLLVLGS
ncbi:MAG: DMT family transporter [Opitutales bacterium]|nr:DMT family transporter [Opitutales bacterium]